MRSTAIAIATAISALGMSLPAAATPLSVRDSFRIGTSGTIFCSAQTVTVDAVLKDMFDSGYAVTCRDAALPVGKLYKLRATANASARLTADRADKVCTAPASANLPNLGRVEMIECKLKNADVGYRVYQFSKGRSLYAAEGLAGYDGVLQLGLRSLVADQPVSGELSIATTGAGDPAAFARVQAGTLDASTALAEAYRRNNAGNYAEAAEFFAAVAGNGDAPLSRAEALANEALQKSNLGRFAEADALFARAAEQLGSDPLVARRLRNYRAMHLLNEGDSKAALAELDKPLPTSSIDDGGTAKGLEIDAVAAKRLNADSKLGQQLGAESDELLPAEKAEILDAQALQLRGSALRLGGDLAAAAGALRSADARVAAVRSGKVESIVWMRAQIAGDLASIAEEQKNSAEADRLYRQGVTILEASYPGSSALLNARARLAGYLARSGQAAPAEAMFRDIVHSQGDTNNLAPSFAHLLKPYVDVLLQKANDDPTATGEIFAATQLMVRPGLAQTQAVLARELSGGTDEASRLFRQAVTLTRQLERNRVELARLQDLARPSPADLGRMAVLRSSLQQTQKDQVATQAALAGFPRYRAVASEVIPLADLQKALRPGEAYYRMTIVGDQGYAVLVMPTSAKAVALTATGKQLGEQVDALRDTISTVENGKRITYAFDVGLSHQLYSELFGPFDAELAGVKHLIFEPDGAMLRLPPNLLVMDQASVDMYKKRAATGGDAEFDFRGVRWFGRDRDMSTSVSPRSFAELRKAPRSAAPKDYLGLGENTPPAASAVVIPAAADRDCILPLSSWGNPISPKELQTAATIVRKFDPNGVQIVTGNDFTDTALEARSDLNQYRIIHFATHGVVTSRAPKCAAQPALLTSFGGSGSDGLLTFREIFDLHLDADLVILSACDTAGKASAAATQQAGLATGGDVALDGLVRAFVGAGGRLVIASHWPVPDDFNATQRLISGLFSAPPGTPTVEALRMAQRELMDDPNTSHPFYWSAFTAVGDGEIPVIRAKQQIATAK